jgi:hypothetical protein
MTDGGTYISQASQTTDPATAGKAVCRFTVTTAGAYTVSATINASVSNGDSVFVSIDELPTSPTTVWDVSPLTTGAEARLVTWRGSSVGVPEFSPKTFTLTAGEHTFYIYGREAGMQIDQITLIPPATLSGKSSGQLKLRGGAKIR